MLKAEKKGRMEKEKLKMLEKKEIIGREVLIKGVEEYTRVKR